MAWFTRPERTPSEYLLEQLAEMRDRIAALEARCRGFDLDMENFTSEVGRAAKRAYKREVDETKRLGAAQGDQRQGTFTLESSREQRKAAVRQKRGA